jgi:hypothetical protein
MTYVTVTPVAIIDTEDNIHGMVHIYISNIEHFTYINTNLQVNPLHLKFGLIREVAFDGRCLIRR